MKAEFELTIDKKTGEPVIQFTHHDKSGALEQKLLGRFIESAKKNGIRLTRVGQSTGNNENCISKDFYEIR